MSAPSPPCSTPRRIAHCGGARINTSASRTPHPRAREHALEPAMGPRFVEPEVSKPRAIGRIQVSGSAMAQICGTQGATAGAAPRAPAPRF